MTPALLLAKTGEAAKAGPIGLVVILVLCIACYFLFKSMSKHMRRVREQFPGSTRADQPQDAPAGPEPATAPPAVLPAQPDEPRP